MAYSRRRTYRRHKRPPLSNRQERAVKAIALGTAETKHYVYTQDVTTLLADPAYYTVGINSAIWAGNIIAPIPRIIDRVVTPTNESVEGSMMDFRGWKFWIDLQTVAATSTTPVYTAQYRFTVYRSNSYGGAVVFNTNGSDLLDPDFPFTSPTQFVWDNRKVDIVYQRKWTRGSGGSPSALTDLTFWVPMKRKLVMKEEENSTAVVGELLGWNYYYSLEMRQPGSANLATSIGGQVAWKAYWKDP